LHFREVSRVSQTGQYSIASSSRVDVWDCCGLSSIGFLYQSYRDYNPSVRWSLLLVALSAAAQVPKQDSRNLNLPNTDTHFMMPVYKTRAEWEARRARLRKQILFASGLDPMPIRCPLEPQIFGRLERPGYTIEKVLIQTLPGFYLGGNLY